MSETTTLSSQVAAPAAFPPAVQESSRRSTSSPALGVVGALDFGRSDRCAVESHCSISISLMTRTRSIFPFAYLSSVYLVRGLGRSWAHFLIGLFVFLLNVQSSCILWIIVLYQMYLLQLFPLDVVFFPFPPVSSPAAGPCLGSLVVFDPHAPWSLPIWDSPQSFLSFLIWHF